MHTWKLTFAALVCLCLFAGCSQENQSPEQTKAQGDTIRQVFQARLDARSKVVKFGGGGTKDTFYDVKYCDLLKAIAVTNCPQPFQNAWAGYIHTWETATNKNNTKDVKFLLYRSEAAPAPDGLGSIIGTDAAKPLESIDTVAAFHKCEAAAKKYGVEPMPGPTIP